MTKFKPFKLLSKLSFIPDDIDLQIPRSSTVSADLRHFLIYIPWDKKYLKYVAADQYELFMVTLQYLHARTTDVHTAICLQFVPKLIAAINKPVSSKVIYNAFILHDTGWGQMTDDEIANSLGVAGLALSDKAVGPKEKHARLGVEIAKEVLEGNPDNYGLTPGELNLVYDTILYHDKPQELKTGGKIPLETQIVCDIDHLWSFTHENFWQDTVRKAVEPEVYLGNLRKDLDDYFVTNEGKAMAREMLSYREKEVEEYLGVV